MTLGSWLKGAAVVIALVAAASVYFAWRGTQHEQAQLKAELQATQKALGDADARQQSRNAELTQLLTQLNEKKATVQNPAQIMKALPDVLPLPAPLTLPAQTANTSLPAVPGGAKQPTETPNPKLQLPAEDLKPLYDFAVNCQECQAQLAATQANLKDEQTKTQAVSRERDTALQAARGEMVCDWRSSGRGGREIGAIGRDHTLAVMELREEGGARTLNQDSDPPLKKGGPHVHTD